MIISKAKEIHQSHVAAGQYQKNVEFEASIGWLQKFMCRHNLSCRIATTVCQKPPEAYEKKIVDFIVYIRNKIKERNFDEKSIFASDETAVWIDCSNTKCVNKKG